MTERKDATPTLKEFCELVGLPYPLPLPGTKEAEELLDKVCPPL